MSTNRVPAVEGWLTMDEPDPRLHELTLQLRGEAGNRRVDGCQSRNHRQSGALGSPLIGVVYTR
jgi:hypothetical protein